MVRRLCAGLSALLGCSPTGQNDYARAIERLRDSGGTFMVIRSREQSPGEPRREFNWRILTVTSRDKVVVYRSMPRDGYLAKAIPCYIFAIYQAQWLAEIEREITGYLGERQRPWQPAGRPAALTRRTADFVFLDQVRRQVYDEHGVTPELLDVYALYLKGKVAA